MGLGYTEFKFPDWNTLDNIHTLSIGLFSFLGQMND